MFKKVYNTISIIVTIILVITAVVYTVRINNTYKEIEIMKEEVARISADSLDLYKMSEIMNLYKNNYINDMEDKEFYQDVMLKALATAYNDQYGAYFTADEAASVEKDLAGEYKGVGIVVLYPENVDYIVVEQVYAGLPADRAGIKVGDQITKINGLGTRTEEGIKELQGLSKSGDKEVILTINDKDIVVSLEVVHIDAITVEVQGTTGIVKINQFTETCDKEFMEKFDNMMENNNIENLIFDVRDNSGGDKIAVTNIIDRLAPAGEIYTEWYRTHEKVIKSDSKCVDIPIYILGNGKSASASELFIMALQDTNDATFIGEITFGKSTILGYFPFDDGSSLFMSIGYYYPPSDRFIEAVGIAPDIYEADDPLGKALELINS